jgi:hypothetical protein
MTAEAARGRDEPGRAHSPASWRSKTSGAGEERETLMGATRAALRRSEGRARAREAAGGGAGRRRGGAPRRR